MFFLFYFIIIIITTTPVNIDYNGIKVPSQNEDIAITFTMDGADKGLIFEYDKTTANPKTFKITSAGMNFTDNTNNLTTPLQNIALLQTVLDALELPPDATTLKVENAIQLKDGVNTATISNTGGNLNINCSTGQVQFSQTPHSSNPPTTANDLTNKSYVDGLFSITNVNNNQDYYPLFVPGTGTGVTMFADVSTGPFTYNPSNGKFSSPGIYIDPVAPETIRMGNLARSAGSYGAKSIAMGTNTGQYMGTETICLGLGSGTPTSGTAGAGNYCVNIGTNCGQNGQADECIAIGINCGVTGQRQGAIAIGNQTGQFGQGLYAIGIGYQAGRTNQGDYSIAIGRDAASSNQPANSICINGTVNSFNSVANGTCIRPIRGVSHGIGVGRMHYNTTTFELTYSTN